MKESNWRSKLVKEFKDKNTTGFIWINDVRYFAGFPDVYIVLNGVCRHYELKLCKRGEYVNQMTKLQEAVCERLANAGVHTSCLTYVPALNVVFIKNFSQETEYSLGYQIFLDRWREGQLL